MGQDAEGTYKIDGRVERSKLHAREKHDEWKERLAAIDFTQCQENTTVLSGEALDAFKKDLRAKIQTAASVKGEVRTLVNRLEKGVSADHVGDEIEQLNAVQDEASMVILAIHEGCGS